MTKHTLEAAAVTDLILEVFRLNGQLLVTGDRLTRPLGLTSARWQVLGAIDIAGHPVSVAQIGRRMGVSRQSVQRITNDLEAEGFVTYELNPDHARAKFVVLTAKGSISLQKIKAAQSEWANTLTEGMNARRIKQAVNVLREVQQRSEVIESPAS